MCCLSFKIVHSFKIFCKSHFLAVQTLLLLWKALKRTIMLLPWLLPWASHRIWIIRGIRFYWMFGCSSLELSLRLVVVWLFLRSFGSNWLANWFLFNWFRLFDSIGLLVWVFWLEYWLNFSTNLSLCWLLGGLFVGRTWLGRVGRPSGYELSCLLFLFFNSPLHLCIILAILILILIFQRRVGI